MSKIYKPRPISGFLEWLPEMRALELEWLDHIRAVFESYGFVNIETPAVEEVDVLLSKGETDKEIYTIHRIQADENDKSDARLALHFDLTVPFARYTAQHFNELSFPFKRYQMQKVWRGERPQEGRYREFYQCDIDIINPDNLPMHFDAELPAVIDEILQGLNLPAYKIIINNRKILLGYMQALGLTDNAAAALRIMDKRDKIGVDGVKKQLVEQMKLPTDIAERAIQILPIKGSDLGVIDKARALKIDNALFNEGLEELAYVLSSLQGLVGNRVVADLSIVRGFDYYTGTVYETQFDEYPELGSIVSGGRYADLASSYIAKDLPGVGISIGLSRALGALYGKGLIKPKRASKTQVLVTVFDDEQRTEALKVAAGFRKRGIAAEVYHTAQKLHKQFAYAEKKEIPYVWFLPAEGKGHEIKDMAARTQGPADPGKWMPDAK
jgi:histidyl-tRNA synthetase